MNLHDDRGTIEKITSASVLEPPPGLYSHCLRAGGIVYVSGQHAGLPGGGVVGDANVFEQAREALRRIVSLVEAAGATAADVVKMTVYLIDMSHRSEVSRARREFFSDPLPCSTLIGVNALAEPHLLVEIEATAVIRGSHPRAAAQE